MVDSATVVGIAETLNREWSFQCVLLKDFIENNMKSIMLVRMELCHIQATLADKRASEAHVSQIEAQAIQCKLKLARAGFADDERNLNWRWVDSNCLKNTLALALPSCYHVQRAAVTTEQE